MKKLVNTTVSQSQADLGLLILRLGAGGMMLVHGYPKLLTLFGDEPVQFMEFMGMSAAVSLALTVFAEFFCSLLIILGLGTRLAVIPLIITMLVAVFMVHADDPFSNKELGLFYLTAYLVLLIMGSGRFAVDRVVNKK